MPRSIIRGPELKATIEPVGSAIAAKFRQAQALHKAGQLAPARAVYEEILRLSPRHFDALHLSGVIAAQTNDPARAVALIGQALEIAPGHAPAHNNFGLALKDLGRHEAALASFERAIELKGDFADAHFNRANVLAEQHRPDEALAAYEQAIVHKPASAAAYFNRGNVLYALGRLDAALASYDRVIALQPGHAAAYVNRGVVLSARKEWQAALASLDRAVSISPDDAEAHSNRAGVLRELGQLDAALAACERALARRPDHAGAHANRGNVLHALGRPQDALESYERSLALYGEAAHTHFNRGNVLADLGRATEALASYDRAIALRPDHVEAHGNRGNVLKELEQLDAALAAYDRALALRPDHAEAHLGRATAWLLRGDFARGWAEYEWRLRLADAAAVGLDRHRDPAIAGLDPTTAGVDPAIAGVELATPWRDGAAAWCTSQSLAGQTVLVRAEQGLGDTLQFCRYAKLVASLGACVVLEVQEPLIGLLRGVEGVSQVIARGTAPPPFDHEVPLMSLPLAFATDLHSIPSAPRYLAADASRVAQWQERLGDDTRPRVGLVWRGNPRHSQDQSRSIPFERLAAHLPSGYQYVSLHREIPEADAAAVRAMPNLAVFGGELDFDNTAALCECLDLVISVDTSLAHLAAGLGRRTWLLLSIVPDWRWLLERSDSPWYPSATLFRQRRRGDWSDVLEHVAAALSAASRPGIEPQG